VIGCGNIAQKFVSDLQYVENSTLYAVASKNNERAKSFAKKHNAKKSYNNYDQLINDEKVDIVYIATTHNFHYKNALLCLNSIKPVLCEKPLCVNAKEAKHLISVSKEKKVFLMEAMWTRFLPAIKHLINNINNDVIGKPKLIQADFGIKKPPVKNSRFYENKLAAGSLLDLGVYTINFCNFIFDLKPNESSGFAKITNQKTDEYAIYNLKYDKGRLAQLSASVSFATPHEARIYGEKGKVIVPDFYHPQKYTIYLSTGEEIKINKPFQGFGYQFEALEAQNCLLNNKIESPTFPLENSLSVLRTMDDLRKEWGVQYENDI
jgi:predicted dehydrogenase|tara:strand:+ start:939 stop:1901 length:963 start_codon:yes stop_codon:yes gene_type:complete